VAGLADYLDLTVGQAREQFRALAARRPVQGRRQVTFTPVETLLCLAASFLMNHRHYGGATADRAPEPVPSLARLFSRPSSSVLAKMANLDGSRSHGGRWDVLAGAMLRDDPARFSWVYRVLLQAARAEGVGNDRLPDFLGLEHGGELALLGQEELDISVLEASLRDQVSKQIGGTVWSELETERILLAAVRVGQHGLAACPAHDAAFDTGMITVNGGLRIHLARPLAEAVQADPLTRQYYGRPPLREVLLLPDGAQAPRSKYLEWHKRNVFVP
jgi:putative restriction endonuclease